MGSGDLGLDGEHALAVIENGPGDIAPAVRNVRGYLDATMAKSTRDDYVRAWVHFGRWCMDRGFVALPAEVATVVLYVGVLAGDPATPEAGERPSTLGKRLAAIGRIHRLAGHDPPPTASEPVRMLMRGVRRRKGARPRRKAPLSVAQMRAIVAALPGTVKGVRDRALLLLGFAGAFRRSEVVALDVEDVAFVPEGMRVLLRRSKTDQEGAGLVKGLPTGRRPETCAVQAVQTWIATASLSSGPLLRPVDRHGRVAGRRLSGHMVGCVVKEAVRRVGLDASLFSGHSLRSGLATSAAAAGAAERDIMRQTGHRSERQIRAYIREGSVFVDNAVARLDL